MRALVCEKKGQPLEVRQIPTPEAVPGSIIVKVLAANLEPNMRKILSGEMGFGFPEPMVPGARGVGRVALTGPDTTSLSEGQLVLLEPLVRARDNPDVFGLLGTYDGRTPECKKWFADNWRNGLWAEYARVPLETCWALNEKALCGDLGYTIPDLTQLTVQAVALGGLQGIGLKAGETIIVAPATGIYSSAAVVVADAMGANVIACGRNINALKMLEATFPRVRIVQFKGDIEEDTAQILAHGPADAYIELSPPAASESTHFRSCFAALGRHARVALVGGSATKNLHVSYLETISKNLTIYGSAMYESGIVKMLIKMAESGVLKLGKNGGQEIVGEFPLEELDKAFDTTIAKSAAGQMTVLIP